MKICNISIGDKSVSTDDLMNAIKSGSESAVRELLGVEELPDMVRKILVRYGVANMEDSVMEMQAKRNAEKAGVTLPEYPSKEEVDYWVYPTGQFNDYLTQKQIHKNTYSGIRLTGISANSGKTLAYLFEGTPITSILDSSSGVEYKGEGIRRLLNAYKTDTVSELVRKNPQFEVTGREEVIIKPQFHWGMDGVKLDKFRRYELDKEGGDKVHPVSGLRISIFETIDSIINLAIDNVKEMKLFVYGITNANANAFFAALAFGAPLNSVVKMFTSPTIRRVSSGGRIYQEAINSEINSIIDSMDRNLLVIPTSTLEKFLNPEQIITLSRDINRSKLSSSDLVDKVAKYIANNGTINTEILDGAYTGDASLPLEDDLSDLILLTSLSKLLTVGEEMFANARLFSILRSMPSSMSGIEYLTEKPMEYSQFNYAASVEDFDIEAYIAHAKEYIKENDPEYAKTPNKETYLSQFETTIRNPRNRELISNEMSAEFEAKFRNAMAYATLRKEAKPTSKSVFTNMSPFTIPHVYSAWKTLNMLKNISEKSFALHNPVLKKFMSDLVEEAGMFTGYNRFELVEQMMLEFFKAMSSNLKLDVNGDELTMNTKDYTKNVNGILLRGAEAWSQDFLERLLQLKSQLGDNRFLENIEIEKEEGFFTMSIYADKVDDVKIREGIRQDFMRLYNDPQTRQYALDTFKYSILTEGLLYSRSNMALIFPPSFMAAYSREFDRVMSSFLDSNRRVVLARLATMDKLFLYQFVRNFPDLVGYIQGYKPESTATISNGEYSTLLYSGVETVGDTKIYYDLKYPGLPSKNARKLIKRYGDEVYIKIDTDTNDTYYRQITEKTAHQYYDVEIDESLSTEFDLDKLAKPAIIVPNSFVNGGLLVDPNPSVQYAVGDVIQTFERGRVKPDILTSYEVTEATKKGYKLKRLPVVDGLITRSDSIFAKYPVLTKSNSSRIVSDTQSIVKTVTRAKANENGYAIVTSSSLNLPNVLAIDPNGRDLYYHNLVHEIEKLDPNKVYYIQAKLLDGVPEKHRTELAEALYKQIGYADRNIDSELAEADDAISRYYKLRSMTKNRLHFIGGYDASAAYNPDVLNDINQKGTFDIEVRTNSVFKKVKDGDVVFMGMRGSLPQFAYVESINIVSGSPSTITMSLIPPQAATAMVRDNYTQEEYESILKENKIIC